MKVEMIYKKEELVKRIYRGTNATLICLVVGYLLSFLDIRFGLFIYCLAILGYIQRTKFQIIYNILYKKDILKGKK